VNCPTKAQAEFPSSILSILYLSSRVATAPGQLREERGKEIGPNRPSVVGGLAEAYLPLLREMRRSGGRYALSIGGELVEIGDEK